MALFSLTVCHKEKRLRNCRTKFKKELPRVSAPLCFCICPLTAFAYYKEQCPSPGVGYRPEELIPPSEHPQLVRGRGVLGKQFYLLYV